MAKKPGRGPSKVKKASIKKDAHAKALDENTSALARHTDELNHNTAALAAHSAILKGVSARQLVYSILQEPLTLPDTTSLSKLLLDPEALSETARKIQQRGINVDTGLVQACKTIADLVKVVEAAM